MNDAFKYHPFTYNPLFSQDIINDACVHSRQDWPNESCGAVIENRYIRFENKSDNPLNSFLIDDPIFFNAYIDKRVQAVIHSHENFPMASVEDQKQQMELDIPYGIINMKNRGITHIVFWGDGVPTAPLMDRFFFYGVFDCFGLMRDHLKTTKNILMTNPTREFAFWHKNVSMFEKFIFEDDIPLKLVDKKDIQPGDYVLYNIYGTKYCNHIGIVERKDLFMHHFYNEISKRYPASYFWEYLKYVLRYDSEWDGWDKTTDWEKIK